MSYRVISSLSDLAATSSVGRGDPHEQLEREVIALFEEFRRPLLRYLSGFGLELADGEEVLQEVFLALFQHLRSGKSRENLRAWLYRVAQNQGLKRRLQARRGSKTSTESSNGDLIDPLPDPEAQVVQNQTQQSLLAALAALPAQDRRCLFLRAQGLRYRDIAKVLDISLGSVSLSLARSLARMARAAKR